MYGDTGLSEIWQEITVDQRETIQFEWNLLTNDRADVDEAFVSLLHDPVPGCPQFPQFPCPPVLVLAGSAAATIGIPAGSEPPVTVSGTYYRQTGWRTTQLTLHEAGTYTLVFGVAQEEDQFQGTALLIDGIHFVSEPATLALFGIAFAGLGFARRR